MERRVKLGVLLKGILGNSRVYYQAPPNQTLEYPCIKYERSKFESEFAGNRPYRIKTRYSILVMYRDPDFSVPKKIAELPQCEHDRKYVVDGLYHDVFSIYY